MTAPSEELVEKAGVAFIIASRQIDRDALLHEITDDELRLLVRAVIAAIQPSVDVVELREANAKLQAELDEQSAWDDVVDRCGGLDQFDALADAWIAREPIRLTIRAATSVFSKWANDELMQRYHAGIEAQIHLAFVEGAAAGARAALSNIGNGLSRISRGEEEGGERPTS